MAGAERSNQDKTPSPGLAVPVCMQMPMRQAGSAKEGVSRWSSIYRESKGSVVTPGRREDDSMMRTKRAEDSCDEVVLGIRVARGGLE